MTTFCKIIGALLFIFGVLDLGLFYIADIDLTGFSWSPWAAFVAGGFFWKFADKDSDESEENEEAKETEQA